MNLSQNIENSMKESIAQKASDIFLIEGSVPRLQIKGEIIRLEQEPFTTLSREELWSLINDDFIAKNEVYKRDFGTKKSLDAAFSYGNHRFRLNACFDGMGRLRLVLRVMPCNPKSIEEIDNIADKYKTDFINAANLSTGLVIFGSPTGEGKTTTLAGIIEYLNRTQRISIMTLEDPIEYIFQENLSTIEQREIGPLLPSFRQGLIDGMRRHPRIIVIGEIRNHETMEEAIRVAETGHLVFATIHAANSIQAVNRCISFLNNNPGSMDQLANVLERIFSQRLVKNTDGELELVVEAVRIDSPIRSHIKAGNPQQINGYFGIKDSGNYCLENELFDMFKNDKLFKESVFRYATNKNHVSELFSGDNN